MFKRFRKNLVAAVAVLGLSLAPVVALTASVSAQNIQENLKCGTTLSTTASSGCNVDGGTDKVNSLITQIVNIFSLVVGIVSVIMIIYGGFRYVTSGGDSSNVSNAKNTIIYAIIGLVVVALAQFIVQFVLDKVTSNPT
ncbi:MAG: Mbov_0395 family pilin-like conjugal transfer protein [Candidatus Saccharimonadales bacterium]